MTMQPSIESTAPMTLQDALVLIDNLKQQLAESERIRLAQGGQDITLDLELQAARAVRDAPPSFWEDLARDEMRRRVIEFYGPARVTEATVVALVEQEIERRRVNWTAKA
jgi:hypothetical protein